MKRLCLAVLLCLSCATVNPYAYEEADVCPASMSDSQKESGIVRCRAMCSSYGRDFATFGDDCKCYCAPAAGQGGYRPSAPPKHKTEPQA